MTLQLWQDGLQRKEREEWKGGGRKGIVCLCLKACLLMTNAEKEGRESKYGAFLCPETCPEWVEEKASLLLSFSSLIIRTADEKLLPPGLSARSRTSH